MAKIIAVYSVKGGVGKSSLAVNLAAISAMRGGHKTLLWDLDAQGSASFLCGETETKASATAIFSRDVAPSEFIVETRWQSFAVLAADPSLRAAEHLLHDIEKPKRLRKILGNLDGHYDYIFLDCPPGLTELSDQVFRAADLILIPCVPTALSARAMDQLIAYMAGLKGKAPQIMSIISMADRRKALHRAFIEERPDWLVVPQSSLIERMTEECAPLEVFAPNAKPAIALRAIWAEIYQRISASQVGKERVRHRGRPRIPKQAKS